MYLGFCFSFGEHMKDVGNYGEFSKENHRIYLYKLDIDENGVPIKLGCGMERYLLYHILLFDEVILQTSAILKIPDLFHYFLLHEDLFTATHNGHHLIAPYRGIETSLSSRFFEEYLGGRIEAVGKESRINGELLAYENNRADLIAQRLDSCYIQNLPVSAQNTDQLFRDGVIKTGQPFLSEIDSSDKLYNLFSSFAQIAEAFQTFILLQRTERTQNINEKGIKEIGIWLRKKYFDANAAATQCFSTTDIHVDFAFIKKYIEMTGLDRVVDSVNRTDPEIIKQIKEWDCYAYLQWVFFNGSVSVLDKLYDLYQLHRYAKGSKQFYESKIFFDYCKSGGYNGDYFVKAMRSMHKRLDELLKQRKRARSIWVKGC